MTGPLVLIVDDEPDILELLEITLSRMGLQTRPAANLTAAHRLLSQYDFDLCLTDMRLPDGDGIELVKHINQHRPQLPIAVITAHGSMQTAIEALKAGAFDFLSKPVDLDGLRVLVSSALKLEEKHGHGGDRLIADLLHLDPHTVAKGRRELIDQNVGLDSVRAAGGGRKSIEKKHPKSSTK